MTNLKTHEMGKCIIEELAFINEPIAVTELADCLELSASRVSTVITWLEAKGYLLKFRLGNYTFVEPTSQGLEWVNWIPF